MRHYENSRVYILLKYADTLLAKSLEELHVIGRIQLITCKLKIKFLREADCCETLKRVVRSGLTLGEKMDMIEMVIVESY